MNTRLTQIFSIGLISLTLAACAATDSNSKSPAADARASLGKITQKQTIQQYSQRRSSPVDVSVGVGGGGNVGWGVNVGLGQIFNLGQISSPEVMYRYTVQTNPNETFIVQTGDEFNVNDCVTLWQRTNDAAYPRIRINSSCTLPR